MTDTEPSKRSHAPPQPVRPRTFWKRTATVWIPVSVLLVWFGYMWFVSGVIPAREKYPDGTIKAEGFLKRVSFSEYRPHGDWATFHPNGQRASTGRYDRGNKVGEWSYWDTGGRPTTQPSEEAPD